MGKISSKRRSFEIKKRQKRRKKIAKLRKIYAQAETEEERKKVIEKLHRLALHLSKEEFLAPLKNSSDSKD